VSLSLFHEKKKYAYHYGDPACFKHGDIKMMGQAPTGTEWVRVEWPSDKTPQMCAHFCDLMSVSLINGVVHGVTLYTSGYAKQERDYELLVQKIGNHFSKDIKLLQNRMGASFDVIDAAWRRPGGITILFIGATHDLDVGLLTAESDEEAARERERAEKKNEGKPKL